MYDDHYGLSGRPFQLTPDPKFWFDTATHRKAMAYLGYGLSQGEGFVVITGEPGAGKTTLMGHLLAQVDAERLNVIKIVSTQLPAEDLLRTVASGLGLEVAGQSKAAMLSGIEKGLHNVARSGKRTLLIVDEAQALPIESLEELRMLSNFQAGGYPLLQIFLLGQPELRDQLYDQRLDQLRQRVIAMHQLGAMDADEVEPYLIHRLSVVGWRGKPRFTNDAIAAMYRWSGGSPRKLNQLATRVLLYGAIEQIETFHGPDIETVIADLDSDTADFAGHRPAPAPAPAQAASAASPPPPPEPTPPEPTPPQPTPPASSAGIAAMPSLDEMLNLGPEEIRAAATQAPAPPPAGKGSGDNPALLRRVEALEAQLQSQDEVLRRVLTLLVDWVESDSRRPDISSLRDDAA
ncbi:ExeA family protein [Stakelama tenebrarum]|uniref:AAA family ATPase n=1 Tax=Stakelama tenebrarum TaxID=2711215 RepID=A0A6G6Y7B6_9SPHN|nr:AAA family ATPase [Sphingosinithalassobacter tenebrarum]QIG80687.1 AAA family ATPase [Sphingosinithalassobacter tenebrarum]